MMTEGEEVFFTHYVEYIDMRLRRFFNKLLIAFALLGLTSAALGLYVSHVATENKKGLCALRDDAEDRIAQTKEFIAQHPDGIPGISIAQLKRSTNNSVRTADALKGVDCDG